MELTLHGCRLRMDFSFPALLALLLLCKEPLLLRQTMCVCLLHEAGHGIAMCLTRAGIREISLTAAGMQMRTKSPFLSRKQEICILLSGPMLNFLMAGILWLWHGSTDTVMLHLCMGAFNLLPFSVLDGGSLLASLFAGNAPLLCVQTLLCMLLSAAAAAFLAFHRISNPFLYLMFFYLAIAQLRVDKQGGIW